MTERLQASPGHVRLISLLAAASEAGLTPIRLRALHGVAYLANVLSPVWDIEPMDGKVFKSATGPFYPDLQADLDRLVGMGLVAIQGVVHVVDDQGNWRLDALVELNDEFAGPVLSVVNRFRDERTIGGFLGEMCLALTAFASPDLESAPFEDATFGDPMTARGNVVDFGEWQTRNFSANAANRFATLAPEAVKLGRAERVHLYLRHLQGRLSQ